MARDMYLPMFDTAVLPSRVQTASALSDWPVAVPGAWVVALAESTTLPVCW